MNGLFSIGDTAPDFSFETLWNGNNSFYNMLEQSKVFLLFLRYIGCPLCRIKIDELIRDLDQFEAHGVRPVAVLQSAPEVMRDQKEQKEIPLTVVCDPKAEIFEQYGVKVGSIFRYLTPSVIRKGLASNKLGYGHGKYEGREKQLPAVFLVDTDRIIRYAYYGKNVGDVPENSTLLKIIS
ncbi:MAG: AhpC/TSA family protein [Proteobacteria bacterium]|nr:AhpC/TSA family protein [Pseudomonadota bacterium]